MNNFFFTIFYIAATEVGEAIGAKRMWWWNAKSMLGYL